MKNKTLKEKAYISIYNLLINNVVGPNEIFNLSDIERHIDIGRGPIRDALNELCNENILKVLPRYGYQVVPIDSKELIEMINFREIIECESLSRNWNLLMNNKEIVEVLKYDHIIVKNNIDFFEEWDNNVRFHKTILSISNNRHIINYLDDTMKKMLRFFVQNYSERWEELNKNVYTNDHEIILQAILDENKEKAIKHLSYDIKGFKRE
ncbi:MAG: GntR family transcriptional regulator [Tissierellia bacterium]|jgi:DNA-binding GntR family transcriptional regulator|nr:GntR family transcriptional regulator [Tissierellia bacterium]